ncbi:BolA family transcriptional regulator [Thalassococcus sp. CAU 1522]|uniref:BolA family transcriptional regulator n=1 Tax=Thalassococcus arenae TaxID=2851652 RepID=A0ABS6NB98_9RHOB|nr:BolA family protein [Thalassococcus arenae]MBV2361291.1 BolA family transcriptional regulator [Thalassococcus arenae]
MTRDAEIEAKLRAAFTPHVLVVRNDSEKHRGHAGFQEGGESHYHVLIRAAAFDGMSRIARHRAVHAALGPDLVTAIHALSLDIEV